MGDVRRTRGTLCAAVALLALVLFGLVSVPASQAAPGDFLFLWGAPQHSAYALGLATDGNDNVYMTTGRNVQVFNSSGIRIKKWGSYGSGDGQFSYINAIAVDGTGRVYVADTGNARIQVFTSDGTFIAKWGHPDWESNAPAWVASDGRGKVYVAESGYPSGSVKVFDSEGNFLRQLGSRVYLGGVATDTDGNVYVVDRTTYAVAVYDPDGEFLRTAASGDFGTGIAVDKSRNVFVTENARYEWGVEKYDSAGVRVAAFSSCLPPGQELVAEHYWVPKALAVDSTGNLYTLDAYNDGLRAFNSNWEELPQWWTYGAKAGQMSRPVGIAIDSSGNVYETDGNQAATGILYNRVQAFSRDGNSIGKWECCAQTSGITVDDNGKVYVLEADAGVAGYAAAEVGKVFDTSGKFLWRWGAREDEPIHYGIAIDKRGNLLVTDGRSDSFIHVYDNGGRFLRNIESPDGFPEASGIAVDEIGNIYVVNRGNSSVLVFDSAYNFVRKWGSTGSGDGQFSRPAGIAVDGGGYVFVADAGNHRIQVFDSSGAFVKKWGGGSDDNGFFTSPEGVAVDKSSERIYVADSGNNRIQVFEGYGATGPFTVSGTVTLASADGAVGATVSIAGKTATVSETGTFSVGDVPYGTHTVTISKPGFLTKTVAGCVVKSNQSGLVFFLDLAYSVTGTVRQDNSTGPTVAGATVAIGGSTATTGDTGAFTVEQIPYGTHTLKISKDGFLTKTVAYVVNSNQSDVVFSVSAPYSMSGRVRQGSTTGPIVAGATVAVARQTAITSDTGAFVIGNIPYGTHTLTLSKSGFFTKTVAGYAVNSHQSNLVFFLDPAYSMSGKVRQGSATGPVVAGATVSIANKTATTSSTGAFIITGLPAGTYTLSISKSGYLTRTVTGYVVGGTQSSLVFQLSQSCSMSGVVRQGSASGAVLAGATVAIANRTAVTSGTGTFNITGIPAGTHSLSISKRGFVTKTVTGYVVGGNQSGLVFFLPSSYSMSGTVRQGSATGAVLAGATVAIANRTAVTSSTGTFSITGIPAGTHSLTISKSGFVTKTITGYVASSNQSGLVYCLAPAFSVSGTVRSGSATGSVLSGATVSMAGKRATTSSTGTFSITGIAAGTYTVTISRTGYATRTVTGYVVNGSKTVVFFLTASLAASPSPSLPPGRGGVT